MGRTHGRRRRGAAGCRATTHVSGWSLRVGAKLERQRRQLVAEVWVQPKPLAAPYAAWRPRAGRAARATLWTNELRDRLGWRQSCPTDLSLIVTLLL